MAAVSTKLSSVGIVLLSTLCLTQSASLLYTRHMAAQAEPVRVGARLASIEGVTPEGETIVIPETGCTLIRYDSASCPYSRADQQSFSSLEKSLVASGCRSLIVAPDRSDFSCQLSPSCRHTHFSSISVHAAKQLRFSGTPTTLMVLARGRVSWIRNGPMQDADLLAVQTALRR
jgi:hypothetical protein